MKELYDRVELTPIGLGSHADAKAWAARSLDGLKRVIAAVGTNIK